MSIFEKIKNVLPAKISPLKSLYRIFRVLHVAFCILHLVAFFVYGVTAVSHTEFWLYFIGAWCVDELVRAARHIKRLKRRNRELQAHIDELSSEAQVEVQNDELSSEAQVEVQNEIKEQADENKV